MPITDTSFTGINEARREKELAELMKGVEEKAGSKKNLAVVILAAGLGKRMKNPDKPKVMFELSGKPIISYVIELALKLNPDKIIPIVGHRRELVIDYLTKNFNYNFEFAVQEPQLGTGHAVMQTEKFLADFNGDILILSGDVPLLRYETVEMLKQVQHDNGNTATLLTAVLENADGYGRIIRDADGNFQKIIEDKDASVEEKKIKEINPAIYVVNSKALFDALKKITSDNKQKEYYLTDIFNFIPSDKVGTVIVGDENEVKGINSLDQLREIKSFL